VFLISAKDVGRVGVKELESKIKVVCFYEVASK